MCIYVRTNLFRSVGLFHLEAKHCSNMMNSVPVPLWVIWGKGCFPPTRSMCTQDSLLWGFAAGELAISPVKGPCDRPVAHHAEVKGLGLLSLGWEGCKERSQLCTVHGDGRARLLWDRVLGQETTGTALEVMSRHWDIFFLFSLWQSHALIIEKVRKISIFGDSKKFWRALGNLSWLTRPVQVRQVNLQMSLPTYISVHKGKLYIRISSVNPFI